MGVAFSSFQLLKVMASDSSQGIVKPKVALDVGRIGVLLTVGGYTLAQRRLRSKQGCWRNLVAAKPFLKLKSHNAK